MEVITSNGTHETRCIVLRARLEATSRGIAEPSAAIGIEGESEDGVGDAIVPFIISDRLVAKLMVVESKEPARAARGVVPSANPVQYMASMIPQDIRETTAAAK